MTVVTGNFTLTPEQKQFVELLERWPRLLSFWDFNVCECNVAALEEQLGGMSHGERILAQFYLDIWLRDDRRRFDLFEAVATLDHDAFSIVQDWIDNPFYP